MGLGESTSRGKAVATAESSEKPPLSGRLVRALLWELRAELYPKWLKDRLPLPDEVAEDSGHLYEDIQLGALILKLPLGLALALAAGNMQAYEKAVAGLGVYLAVDFLVEYVQLSRGKQAWTRRRYATLAVELLAAGGRLLRSGRALGGRTGPPTQPQAGV